MRLMLNYLRTTKKLMDRLIEGEPYALSTKWGQVQLRTIAHNTDQAITASLTSEEISASSAARFLDSQAAANDKYFSQHQALFELPLKTEQMKAKTENIRTRTAQVEADTRLKEEKIKALQTRSEP